MQKVTAIFLDRILYGLNLWRVLCYFIAMKHAVGVPVCAQGAPQVGKDCSRWSRRGQTLVEYALILAVISIVAIGVLINLGQGVKGVYSTIDSAVAVAHASH